MARDNEPIFVDLDPYNVLFTQESEPRSFIIRPNGGRTAAITLEGKHIDEIIARFPSEDAATEAYDAATRAVTLNDVIALLKAIEVTP